jgi:hypothetical protein
MSNKGEFHYTIGNVIIENWWIILHQTKYLIFKLQKKIMLESNLINTPLLANVHLSKETTPLLKKS